MTDIQDCSHEGSLLGHSGGEAAHYTTTMAEERWFQIDSLNCKSTMAGLQHGEFQGIILYFIRCSGHSHSKKMLTHQNLDDDLPLSGGGYGQQPGDSGDLETDVRERGATSDQEMSAKESVSMSNQERRRK